VILRWRDIAKLPGPNRAFDNESKRVWMRYANEIVAAALAVDQSAVKTTFGELHEVACRVRTKLMNRRWRAIK